MKLTKNSFRTKYWNRKFGWHKILILLQELLLRISPDARAGGLGDQGVATSADAFSQFWNASKFPFSRNTSSAAVSYTPWMGKLTNDVFYYI